MQLILFSNGYYNLRCIEFIPGGTPNVAQTTGGRITQGFKGCIHVVEPLFGGPIDLGRNHQSGMNVNSCPR